MTPQSDKNISSTNKVSKKKNNMNKGNKFPLWINVGVMVLVVVVVGVIAYICTIQYTRHGEEVTVPDLRGLTVQQAFDKLEALGLEADVRDSVYSKELAPGLVWGQSISANSHVKVGRLIALTINTNDTPTLLLPDVADNSSYEEAAALLKSMGFTLNPPQRIDGNKDWVYSVKYQGRNVAAGTRIRINEPITLVVGNGMMPEETEPVQHHVDSLSYGEDIIEIV